MPIEPNEPVPARARSLLLNLYQDALAADEPRLYSLAIEAGVDITGSKIGYFHLVNEDQETIELGTWSAGTLRQCQAVYQRHYPISAAGVWADCARHRRPYIHNDYPSLAHKRGYPEGHVHLVRHLGVPVLDGGRVVLLVGVGNKAAEYDQEDLACLQAISDHAWRLIRQRRERVSLEFSHRHLRELQELATIAIWQWDPLERRLQCDASLRRLFGLQPGADAAWGLESLLRFVDTRDHPAILDALRDPPGDATFDMQIGGVRADGTAIALYLRGAAFPRSQGHGFILRGILQDVSERVEAERIRHQAKHDPLTGLANRTSLLAHLEARLHNSRRQPEDNFAVLFIDLDQFKPVNDTYGHVVGDEVLKIVAQRLLRATRKEDLVARIGGDELVVVAPHVVGIPPAEHLAGKIAAALAQPMHVAGHEFSVTASIGIAIASPAHHTAEQLLAMADDAMYRAKERRRGK